MAVDPFLCAHVFFVDGVVELVDLCNGVGPVAVWELMCCFVCAAEVAEERASEEPEADDLGGDLEGEGDGVLVAGD